MSKSSEFLEDSLTAVKTSIGKNPDSHTTKEAVQGTLDVVLEGTQGFRKFSPQDFTSLMQTVIIAVGYTRGGVTDIRILNELASAVPSKLGIDALFPEVREDGRKGLWLVGSAVLDIERYTQVMGEGYALNILTQCGRYAYFVAGVFPDLLLASERKKGVDVRYFDTWGSAAFDIASKQTVISGTDAPEIFRELAANFQGYRRILNAAGGLVGTPARRTVEKEIVESHLASKHSNSAKGGKASNANRTNEAFGLPLYNPQTASSQFGLSPKLNDTN
ncbi:hypothetical protein HYV85_03945 [Candidatus Woesearchaeota archaeon]|nr:hypothetical protein [Candidatus Woesearchaeota archaeon]